MAKIKNDPNRIALILPYYGMVPSYFSCFLQSIEGRSFDVLFISDHDFYGRVPPNFLQIRLGFNELAEKVRAKLGSDAMLDTPYKLCDYKPLYGYLFEEYIRSYEYFAFGDCDVIFGKKIDEQIARLIDADYDVMSFRKYWISGSFCVLRNTQLLRELPFRASNLKEILRSRECQCFDELCGNWFGALKSGEMSIKDCENRKDSFSAVVWRSDDIKLFHEDLMCEDALNDSWIRVIDGRVWHGGEEVPAFHFINAKRSSAFASGWNRGGLKSKYVISRYGRFPAERVPWWGVVRVPISRIKAFCKRAANEGIVKTITQKVVCMWPSTRRSRDYVGIRTIPVGYLFSNYGTFLQHFALREKLRRMGFHTIRLPRDESRLGTLWIYNFCRLVIRLFRDVVLRRDVDSARAKMRIFARANKFISEFNRFIGHTIDRKAVKRCRFAIAGSDQVFSGYDGYNFMTDISEDVDVFSYAASADWTAAKLSDDWRQKAQSALQRFREISVREEAGATLLKEFLPNRDIQVLCDPVMLLTADDFRRSFKLVSSKQKRVLLCYFLNLKSPDEIDFESLRRYSKGANLELIIVASDNTECFVPRDLLKAPSPREFLQLLDDAEIVVTNSFHGTVLSMIFNRRFIVLYQGDCKGSGQNIRIESILKKFSLSEFASDANKLPKRLSQLAEVDYDWAKINLDIVNFATDSEMWLAKQLRKVC